MRPQPSEYAHYYGKYIEQAAGNDILGAFAIAEQPTFQFLASIPADKADYAYADGKWTIKQLLQHVIDAERIFAYRALCIARGDKTPLPSFDEELYSKNGTAAHRALPDMVAEFKLVRDSAKVLFQGFTPEELKQVGTAVNNPVSVLALGYILIGHSNHHFNVLKERYL